MTAAGAWGPDRTATRRPAGFRAAARPGVVLPAALALLLAAALVLTVGPGRAVQAVEPALDHAIEVAAETGVPAAVYDLTGDGRPDPDAPLVAGLARLSPTVEVRLWPQTERELPEGWGVAEALEVRVAGRPGVACVAVRSSRPSTAVAGWYLDTRGGWLRAATRSTTGSCSLGESPPAPVDVPTGTVTASGEQTP
jgi:hypothetical protein